MKKEIIIIFTILFCSCETDVDLDLIQHDSLLVVNGMLDANSPISINVSHSRGALDEAKITSIKDATIILYENDIELGQMLIDSTPQPIQLTHTVFPNNYHHHDTVYYYYYDTYPNAGSTYSIQVSHPDYKTAFATTRMPEELNFLSVELFTDTTVSTLPHTGYYNTAFNIHFNDNPLEKNFYRTVLYNYWGNVDLAKDYFGELSLHTTDSAGAVRLHSNDASLMYTDLGLSLDYPEYFFSGHHAMFDDDLFNGETKDLSFHVEYDLEQGCLWNDQQFLLMAVYNEDAYYYFKSIAKSNSFLNTPINSEPVPIYSNIENGVGIFAGYSILFQNIKN